INNAAVPLAQGDIPINREKYGVTLQPNLLQLSARGNSIRHAAREAAPRIPRPQPATLTVPPHTSRPNASRVQRGNISLRRLFASHPRFTRRRAVQKYAGMTGTLNSRSGRQTGTEINRSSQTRHSLKLY